MDKLLPIVVSQLVLLPIESDALALAAGVPASAAGFDVAADGLDGPETSHPARNATAQQSAAG